MPKSIFKRKINNRWILRGGLILGLLALIFLIKFFVQPGTIKKNKEKINLGIERIFFGDDYQYQNQNQDFQIKLLDKKTTTPQVQFARGDVKLDMKLLSLNGTTGQLKDYELTQNQNQQDQLNLQEVFPQTDLAYSIIDKGLKEDIILKSPEALQNINKNFYYAFEFNTQGARMGKLENIKNTQAPVFYDNQGNYAFHLLPLIMIDAKGNQSDKIKLVLEKKDDNHYLAKIYPDKQWLTNPDRVFPIKIDPSVVYDESSEFATGSLNRTIDLGSGFSPQVQIQNPFGGNDQYTKLLLHGDGADNSTTFSDSSMSYANRKTVTASGNAKISTTQSEFGGSSAYFDGTGDYLSIPNSSDLDLSSGDFTIDFWAKVADTGDEVFFSKGTNNLDVNQSYGFRYDSGDTTFRFTSGSTCIHATAVNAINTDWHHYAIAKNGSNILIFIDGVLKGTTSCSVTEKNAPLQIGQYYSTSNSYDFNGYLDELRVSKGIARWTSNFTPPTRAYDGPKNYGVYNSPVIDSGDSGTDWQTIAWTENGVQTGDGETPYSTDGLVAQWNFNETSGTTAVSGGTCGTSCNGTLTNMTTSGQDASTNSGWTANNGRWPKTSPAGLMFDGTDDYVSVPVSGNNVTKGNLGFNHNEDFTISVWYKGADNSSTEWGKGLVSWNSTSLYGGLVIRNNKAEYIHAILGAWQHNLISNSLVNDNTWKHIVYVNSGGYGTLYINGKKETADGLSSVMTAGDGSLRYFQPKNIGSNYNEAYTSGIIDNVQLYSRALSANEILSNYNSGNLEIQTRTGNSTDPNDGTWEDWKPSGSGTETAVLSMDEDSDNWEGKMDQYTKLLLHGDGTNGSTSFADKSLYTKTITPAGNAQISTAQSKFGNSAMYFDGSGDYLSIPDSEDWNFGSGDFTVDTWVNFSSLPSSGHSSVLIDSASANDRDWEILWYNNGSIPYLQFASTSTDPTGFQYYVNNNWTPTLNTWYHLAFVYSSGSSSLTQYINGVAQTNKGGTLNIRNSGVAKWIGRHMDQPDYFNGYIDELRISKGIARWTSNFTPPNQAYHNPSWLPVEENKVDNDGNVKLLLHGDGDNNSTNFTDSSFQERPVAFFGNAKISTTQSKFGGSAMSFDGTGDYLSLPDSDDWDFGTGNFAMDYWIYPTAAAAGVYYGHIGGDNNTINGNNAIIVYHYGTDRIVRLTNSGAVSDVATSGNQTLTLNAWNHVAIVRKGLLATDINIYINGIAGNAPQSGNVTLNSDGLVIGRTYVNVDSWYLNGYLDELRISKGIARWTSNFTPPEAPYSDPSTQKIEGTGSMKVEQGKSQCDANTVAYWTLDETGGSGAYLKDSCGTNHGTPTGTTVANGISGKARSFNGTSDYVVNSGLSTGLNGNLTLGFWFKSSLAPGYQARIVDLAQSSNYGLQLCMNTSGQIGFDNTGGPSSNIFTSSRYDDGNWHYVVGVRESSSYKLYIDGIYTNSTSGSVLTYGKIFIGRRYDGFSFFPGQIDEVKISNIARTSEEIAEDYRMGRDHRLSRSLSATDFSSKNKIPFYVAADKTGTFMETTIGESAFANYEPDANTVGLWHLEEQTGTGAYIKDSSNYGNHGTPTGTSLVEGKMGKGRSFNGSSDYVAIGDIDTVESIEKATYEAWFNPSSIGRYQPIITKYNSSNGPGGIDVSIDSGNHAQFFLSNSSDNRLVASTTSAIAVAGQWMHIVALFDGSQASYLNKMKVYINGVEQALSFSATYAFTTIPATTKPLRFGTNTYSDGTQVYAYGQIDEVRIDNIARTASEIRQAYEVGRRTHPITIDFSASLDSANLITNSSDLSFTINSQTTGSPNKGDNLFNGDKIIIKENYDGTEYLAQGTVNSSNQSTGATTITAWDTGSTFPSAGFTQNATVFKWQKEYWDLTGITDNQKNAINRMTLRITDGSEARNIYLDDFKSSSSYLTNPTSSTISSSNNRYFQYRTIFSNNEQMMSVSPTLTSSTVSYLDSAIEAPTNVVASDGSYSDKVVVSWTKSTGATGYRVYRDGVQVGTDLGDVSSFEDTGANAPVILAGAAIAGDGTSKIAVALSLSGASIRNGTEHDYTVVAFNSSVASEASVADSGYRGAQALSYQWQRSASTLNENYSNITGATTASYNDVGAPVDGSVRYYRCTVSSVGAVSVNSSADSGYINSLPVLSTIRPTTITDDSASAQGTISDFGNATVTERGFKYGLTKADTWSVSETGTFSVGNYSLALATLSPNTQYFIRSFAVNEYGTSYGEYLSFYTGIEVGSTELKGEMEFKYNVEIK